MKKSILALFAFALFALSTAPTTAQPDTMTETVCYNDNGDEISCSNGKPKKKRKKR